MIKRNVLRANHMKKKLIIAIMGYMVLVAGILCYAQSPCVVRKRTIKKDNESI